MIWEGWFQFGLTEPIRQLLLAVDLILLIIGLYLVLRFFNSKRGFGYLSLIVLAIVLLIGSAYLTLPGLHFFSQGLLLVLIVGLPLFFEEKWLSLFHSPAGADQVKESPYLKTSHLILLASLTSLLIGFFGNGVTTRTAELPQEITLAAVNNREGTAANFGSVQSVKVIVAAPREIWSQLNAESFSATVDLAGREEGTFELGVIVSSKNPAVKVRRIKPAKLTVTIEPVIKKTLSLAARYTGKADHNLVPDQPQFDPANIEVTGPRSLVSDLTQAFVLIDLNKRSSDIEIFGKIVALNTRGEIIVGVSFDPPETKVKVPLVAVGKVKTVGIVVAINGQPAGGYWIKTIRVTPPTVAVTGAADVLEELIAVETESILIAGLNQDKTQAVTLKLPGGIELVNQSSRFTVTLEVDRIQTTKIVYPEIVYDGLNSSLKVTNVTPNIVNVVISGSPQVLEALNSSSVKLMLRLSSYKTAGTFSVSITSGDVILPESVSLVSFLPSAVDVILENK